MVRLPHRECDGPISARPAWMREHGWTTFQHVEETAAAIDAIVDDLLASRPTGSDPAVEDAASAIRWWMKQLRDQR
jgi:hypothetical protein